MSAKQSHWVLVLVTADQANKLAACPHAACGHPADEHCILTRECKRDGCECGRSETADHRARHAVAENLSGWIATDAELVARGFRPHDKEQR